MDESEYLTAELKAVSAVRRLIGDVVVQIPESIRENSPYREAMLKILDQIARNILENHPTNISMRVSKDWTNLGGSGAGSSGGDAGVQTCPKCGYDF